MLKRISLRTMIKIFVTDKVFQINVKFILNLIILLSISQKKRLCTCLLKTRAKNRANIVCEAAVEANS